MEVPLEEGAAAGPPGLLHWGDAGSYGRGIVDDMARLMADVEVYKTVFEHHMALKTAGVNVDAFSDLESLGLTLSYLKRGLLSGYKGQSKLHSTFSHEPSSQRKWWKKLLHKGRPTEMSLTSLERSTYLAHGLRIINLAFEKSWPCLDPECMVDGQHTAVKTECKMVRLMAQRGLWFLRKARVDEATFCQGEHQDGIHMGAYWPGLGRPWLPELFVKQQRGSWFRLGKGRRV